MDCEIGFLSDFASFPETLGFGIACLSFEGAVNRTVTAVLVTEDDLSVQIGERAIGKSCFSKIVNLCQIM